MQQAVAAAVDATRRELIVVNQLTRSNFLVIPLYEVVSIKPDVVDAAGGTLVTVVGNGFTNATWQSVLCKFGATQNNQLTTEFLSATEIVCVAPMATSYDPCSAVPLEIAFRGEKSFTSNNVLVTQVNVAQVSGIGPSNRGPLTTVSWLNVMGSGFLNTKYLMCRIDGEEFPATFVSATLVRCRPSAKTAPQATTVEVSLDGQSYSNNKKPYFFVGPATQMTAAFAGGGVTTFTSSALLMLPIIDVTFRDAAGTDVRARDPNINYLTVDVVLDAAVDAPKEPPSGEQYGVIIGTQSVTITQGVAKFNTSFAYPGKGTYTLVFSHSGTYELACNLTFTVGAKATKLVFETPPLNYSTNKAVLPTQPVLQYRDEAENLAEEEVGAVTLTLEMADGGAHDGASALSGTAVAVSQGALQYAALRLTDAVPGRTYYLVWTPAGTAIPEARSHPIRIPVCDASDNAVSRIVPDQGLLTGVTITIKGWNFDADMATSMKCKHGEAGTEYAAAFLDTCTMTCALPASASAYAASLYVQTSDRGFADSGLNFTYTATAAQLTYDADTRASFASAALVDIANVTVRFRDDFGNWLKGYDTEGSRRVYMLTDLPLANASGLTPAYLDTADATATFRHIQAPHPVVGTYSFYFTTNASAVLPLNSSYAFVDSGMHTQLSVTITEGVPARLLFDGNFSLFTTNRRKLDTQPRLLVVDAANNTVTAAASVYVRVDVLPPPLCQGTRNNNTQTEAEWAASCTRVAGARVFVVNGVATFSSVLFVGVIGTLYNMTFSSTIVGLPVLTSPTMYVADCPSLQFLDSLVPDWVTNTGGGTIVAKGWDYQETMTLVLSVGGTTVPCVYVDTCTATCTFAVTQTAAGRRAGTLAASALSAASAHSIAMVDQDTAATSSGVAFRVKDVSTAQLGFSLTAQALFAAGAFANTSQQYNASAQWKACSTNATAVDCYVSAATVALRPIFVAQQDAAGGDIFAGYGWTSTNVDVAANVWLVSQPSEDTRPQSDIFANSGAFTVTTVNGIAWLDSLVMTTPRTGDYVFKFNTTALTTAAAAFADTQRYTVRVTQGPPVALVAVDGGVRLAAGGGIARGSGDALKLTVELHDYAGNRIGVSDLDGYASAFLGATIKPVAVIMPQPVPNMTIDATAIMVSNNASKTPTVTTTSQALGAADFSFTQTRTANILFGVNYRMTFAVLTAGLTHLSVAVDLTAASCASTADYALNFTETCTGAPGGGGTRAGNHSLWLFTAPGWWRYRYQDQGRFYACPNDNCVGGFYSSCVTGTTGPTCAVCARGYGKSGKNCLVCAGQVVNVVIVTIVALVVLCVVTILVKMNLSTKVEPKSIMSIIFKILLNHLQTTTLMTDFHARMKGVAAELADAQGSVMPDFNFSNLHCLAGWDMYTIFFVWMVIPVVICVVPGVIAVVAMAVQRWSFRAKIRRLEEEVAEGAALSQDVAHLELHLRALRRRQLPDAVYVNDFDDDGFGARIDDESSERSATRSATPQQYVSSVAPPNGADSDKGAFSGSVDDDDVDIDLNASDRAAKPATMASSPNLSSSQNLSRSQKMSRRVARGSVIAPDGIKLDDTDSDDADELVSVASLGGGEVLVQSVQLSSTFDARSPPKSANRQPGLGGSGAFASQPSGAKTPVKTGTRAFPTRGQLNEDGDGEAVVQTGTRAFPNRRQVESDDEIADNTMTGVGAAAGERAPRVVVFDAGGSTDRDDDDDDAGGGGGAFDSVLGQPVSALLRCTTCRDDFAIYRCDSCDGDRVFCEKCWGVLHSAYGENAAHDFTRIKCQHEETRAVRPEFERLVKEVKATIHQIPPLEIYIVTVLVIIFLVYPNLISMIAKMLRCVEIDSLGRSFLAADMTIDCGTAKYQTWRAAATVMFVIYGVGIPLVGTLLLAAMRKTLLHRATMSMFGFLYSGYSKRRFFWEFVVMVRKAVVVFIVVFFEGDADYAIMFGMWLMFAFLLLNIFVQPFQLRIYWRLENLSLTSIAITLNLAMLYQPRFGISSTLDDVITTLIFTVSLSVLVVFAYFIAWAAHRRLLYLIDAEGNVSFTESMLYVRRSIYRKYGERLKGTAFEVADPSRKIAQLKKERTFRSMATAANLRDQSRAEDGVTEAHSKSMRMERRRSSVGAMPLL
jgi:hypothetical protein